MNHPNLDIGFEHPLCSSFEITTDNFPWFHTNVVILCFLRSFNSYFHHEKSCYSFDGKLDYIGDSNYGHGGDGLTKYKEGLLTVGDANNQKTEIMKMDENKNFSWSVAEPDFEFGPGEGIAGHSLVTIPTTNINEEYVLLIGGYSFANMGHLKNSGDL